MADSLDELRTTLSDRYDIDRELGRGGMATVYLARDLKHGRLVAIKVLRPDVAASVGSDRFLREIRTAAQLQHPHILPLHDSGVANGHLYYVMPFVEGESLRDRITREHQLRVDDALRITREIGDALTYAHSRGVVHRDIKPENVLLSSTETGDPGHALVTDFGIARAVSNTTDETLTQAGIAVGTPAYMSPEQASAERAIDGRSDIYSLGCVLYEMLVGHPPFLGATSQEILARHLRDPLPPIRTARPDLSPAVERAVQTALAKSPADRFATASGFTRALASAADTPASRPSLVMRSLVVVTVLALLATGYAVVFRPRAVTPPVAVVPDTALSIAVLPFENMGGNPANEPFSDGVAEDLTTELRKVGRLNVKSRTSAFSFKGRDLTAQEIGRRLGARYVMTGSVQLDRNRRRVNAQLIDVVSGDEIWSDRFDSDAETDDVFAVQDTITRAIVESLRLPLSAVETAMLEQRSTTDREAHELYLQGRYFFEKRDEASLSKASDFFERAIRRDSLYARAYAGLSDAWSHSAVFGYFTPAAVHARAKDAALRALALDSLLVEGHVARGFVALFLEFAFDTAERAFARAVQLDPRYAPGHQFRAWHLISAGRPDEAVENMREAVRLDPFSLVINARMATMLYYARRNEEALAQAGHTLELDSMFFSGRGEYARALLALGRCDEALAFIEKDPVALAVPFRGLRGVAHARCGNRDMALAELDFLRDETARGKYVTRYAFAAIHAALGNRDQAFAELDAALDERAWTLFALLVEPDVDAFRSDPRFIRLLRRIGLQS